MAWAVYVDNDNVNTFDGVAYAVHRIAGLAVGDATQKMTSVHHHGSVEVGRFADLADAELMAARLLVFGLSAHLGEM